LFKAVRCSRLRGHRHLRPIIGRLERHHSIERKLVHLFTGGTYGLVHERLTPAVRGPIRCPHTLSGSATVVLSRIVASSSTVGMLRIVEASVHRAGGSSSGTVLSYRRG